MSSRRRRSSGPAAGGLGSPFPVLWGKAPTSGLWTGFLLALGTFWEGARGRLGRIEIRPSAWSIEPAGLGRVSVGRSSSATDDIPEINLANLPTSIDDLRELWTADLTLRRDDSTGEAEMSRPSRDGVTRASVSIVGDGRRAVRCRRPMPIGWWASTARGRDDIWGGALRFDSEAGGIWLATGGGDREIRDCKDDADGSSGVRHPAIVSGWFRRAGAV